MREVKVHLQHSPRINHQVQGIYKTNYDKKREDRRFKIGDKVLIYFPVTLPEKSKKLIKKWYGPYQVEEVQSPLNYRVKLLNSPKSVPLTVHIERMKKYTSRKEKAKPNEEEEDKFEVFKIMKK